MFIRPLRTLLTKLIKNSGIESSFQTNFLSQFLLTLLLLPRLAPHARIVNVSSLIHHSGHLDPQDIDQSTYLDKSYKLGDIISSGDSMRLYADHKLAQIAFTRELQKRLDASSEYRTKGIVVHAAYPGLVKVRF